MKNSKTLLLLVFVTVLVIAISACAVIPSQTSGAGYNGTTVIATVHEIDGDKLTLGIQSNVNSFTFGSGMSFATFNGTFDYSFMTMSVQNPTSTFSHSYEYNFSEMSLSTNVSVHYFMPAIMLKTFTVAPEMLDGISVGDVVDVTFDENENVIKIEKRVSQAITADKDGKSTSASTAAPAKENEK